MPLTVLVGDDEQAVLRKKAELFKGAEYEKVDCAEAPQDLIDALRSPGLFVAQRKVWAVNAETLPELLVTELTHAMKNSNALLVLRAATLTPKSRAAFKSVGEVASFTQPKGKMVGMRVAEMLKDSGLRIDLSARRLITERVGHDLDRLQSILTQCKIAGLRSPSSAQLEVLIGSSAAPGVPWDLSDAIENGEHRRALEVSDVTPLAAAAYLSNRYLLVAKVAEAPDDREKEAILSGVQKFQAQKILRLAKQIGPAGGAQAVQLLAAFDLKYKSSAQPDGEFDLLLLKLCDIFAI